MALKSEHTSQMDHLQAIEKVSCVCTVHGVYIIKLECEDANFFFQW